VRREHIHALQQPSPLGMLTLGLKRLKNARAPFPVFALVKYLSNTSSPGAQLLLSRPPLLSMHMTRLYERRVDLEHHRLCFRRAVLPEPMKRTARRAQVATTYKNTPPHRAPSQGTSCTSAAATHHKQSFQTFFPRVEPQESGLPYTKKHMGARRDQNRI
jgi:hypothetical protein